MDQNIMTGFIKLFGLGPQTIKFIEHIYLKYLNDNFFFYKSSVQTKFDYKNKLIYFSILVFIVI